CPGFFSNRLVYWGKTAWKGGLGMGPERKRRLLRAGAVLGVLALAGVLLLVFQPPCLVLTATGWYCAGCGGQRMVLSLLRGDVAGAFGQNPYLFFALPLLGAFLLAEGVRYVWGKPPLYRRRWVMAALAAVLAAGLVFMVLRN